MSNNIIEEYFIWDENDCTKQSQNNCKHEEKDNCVTTNETKNDSTPKDLKSTMNEWVRNCPKCNVEISYKYKNNFKKATVEKKICRICAATGKTPHNKLSITDLNKNCPKCNKIIEYNSRNSLLRSLRNNTLCKHCSNLTYPNPRFTGKIHGEKFYKTRVKGNSHPFYGTPLSSEHKEKISLSMRTRRLETYCKVNYNKRACKYFDSLNKQNDWNLQHALNGGEIRIIGYSLDAYDKERNIVVEYDESRHYDENGNLKQKDVLRQQRIITHLGCRFFRYNERTKELYEVKTSMM